MTLLYIKIIQLNLSNIGHRKKGKIIVIYKMGILI